jgi:hypothetical protein
MKYLTILVVLFSGCATVSDYNQGCRDSLQSILDIAPNFTLRSGDNWKKWRDDYCNELERIRLDRLRKEFNNEPPIQKAY